MVVRPRSVTHQCDLTSVTQLTCAGTAAHSAGPAEVGEGGARVKTAWQRTSAEACSWRAGGSCCPRGGDSHFNWHYARLHT